jgi:hypothetical protein
MAVRSALPWPLRWAMLAIVLGFCAAIALWAFEFGKDIAGLDGGAREDLLRARAMIASLNTELATLREARDKAQSIANTAATLLTSEKVAQEKLATQNRQLEADNLRLRDDLGFFEKLIPTGGAENLLIRGLQAEVKSGRQVRWQVLVIQSAKNAPEFNGRLELSFTGTLNGKPWTGNLPEGGQAIKLRQYGRLEGLFELPAQVVLKGVSAKVLEGTTTRAVQSIRL